MHENAVLADTVLGVIGRDALEPAAKEGLALLNGTQLAARGRGLFRAERLLETSIVAGALTVEGLAGSHAPFDARIHAASRLPGQIEAASPAPAAHGQRDPPQPRGL